MKRIITAATVTIALGGLAYATVRDDQNAIKAVTHDGASLGWGARYLWPPDPCYPPDPCKATVGLVVDTSVRTDLNHEVIMRHQEGGLINPCVRVWHAFLADGSMAEVINVLDPQDAVHITVPAGFAIVPDPQGGYTVAPAP